MSNDSTQPLSGRALHFVLQRPNVRAAYERLMALKAPGPRNHAWFDLHEIALADWFRLSREAAKDLTPEQLG